MTTGANGTGKTNRTDVQLEQDQKRQAIVDELIRLRPDCEFEVNQYTTNLVYYTASVIKGKIVISRSTCGIYLSSEPSKLVNYFYRTELEARQSIEAVLPLAKKRYLACLTQFQKLKSDLNFSVGFNYDGDTHGIHNEYEYISFEFKGFSFQFSIDDK